MAILPIVLYPEPILLKPTVPVDGVDDDLRQLIRDMAETMNAAPGIGLAANQVGDNRRVCVVDLSAGEEEGQLFVFVNPKILDADGTQLGEEGCLSFPDITFDVQRAERVVVEALNFDGEPFTLEAEGMFARVILHECEHLSGKTFLSNLSSLKRNLIKKKIKKRIEADDWHPADPS
ncbi:MAG: peptide deformylase [Acidobacteriota bacterium]|nr:peptide deformylase [Acidobacteriota bacterium]MDH3786158.1 peptide deformylase [Acidobacteriota bacterium]